MTTIAFRDGIMAADSQETTDIKMHCRKLFRRTSPTGRRVIIGTAGSSYAGMIHVDSYSKGSERPKVLDNIESDEDFQNLIWDGKALWEINWLWHPIRVPRSHKFFAIGSGAAAALGAMHMGASAKEAVNTAKKIDNLTGGRVSCMSLNNREK